jgi:hypothetical protein
LVCAEPSTRFSFTSPEPAFSPLARTAATLPVWLPGISPVRVGPLTPEERSAVFVHVGCGSPTSKEDEKSPGPAYATGLAMVLAASASAEVMSSLRTRSWLMRKCPPKTFSPSKPAR